MATQVNSAADSPKIDQIIRASVVNIDMPFISMVWFMVKWSLAAIPALFILGCIGFMLFGILAGLGAAIGHSPR